MTSHERAAIIHAESVTLWNELCDELGRDAFLNGSRERQLVELIQMAARALAWPGSDDPHHEKLNAAMRAVIEEEAQAFAAMNIRPAYQRPRTEMAVREGPGFDTTMFGRGG